MATTLSPEAVEFYRENGYYFPHRAITAGRAARLRRRVEAFEAGHPDDRKKALGSHSHLLFPWLYDLVHEGAILDAVEGLIGPNILCWSAGFFNKGARDPVRVTWHQDSTYWGLEPTDIVTAWLAFTPSNRVNGCMRVVPGSHARGQIDHRDTFAADNLLSRGQVVAADISETDAVDIELEPGEMSLHHVRMVHGSEPNRSDHRRMGYAIRYIPTHVRQIGGRTVATLVRGVDDYHHFDLAIRPAADFDRDALARHADAMRRIEPILFAGADRRSARQAGPDKGRGR